MRAPLVAALVLTSALAVGCGEDFPPYNRLTSTRVLAIAAEPPAPGPGETTTIRAFSYIPEVGAGFDLPGVTYNWSWCPFPPPEGAPCEVTPEQIAMLAQAGITLPPLDLGQASSAQFTHSIPVEALAQICAGVPGSPPLLDCQGGFPIQIRVTMTFTGPTVSPTGTDQIVTVSTVRLRFSAKHEPNVSPVIEGLQAERGGFIFPIGVEPAALLPRDAETVIRALVPESSIEVYTGINPKDLTEAQRRERIDLSWFVETGNTDSERTSYVQGEMDPKVMPVIEPQKLVFATDNKWTPGKVEDYAKNLARIIVIVRDNRGGVAVRDGFVNLEEGP
jgi:hypothetical protein